MNPLQSQNPHTNLVTQARGYEGDHPAHYSFSHEFSGGSWSKSPPCQTMPCSNPGSVMWSQFFLGCVCLRMAFTQHSKRPNVSWLHQCRLRVDWQCDSHNTPGRVAAHETGPSSTRSHCFTLYLLVVNMTRVPVVRCWVGIGWETGWVGRPKGWVGRGCERGDGGGVGPVPPPRDRFGGRGGARWIRSDSLWSRGRSDDRAAQKPPSVD